MDKILVDKNQMTPIMQAAMHGHVEVVAELIRRGARLDATDKNGATAVYRAVNNNRLAALRALLAAGAPTEGVSEGSGMTPAMHAAWDGDHECLALLLEHRAIASQWFSPLVVITL